MIVAPKRFRNPPPSASRNVDHRFTSNERRAQRAESHGGRIANNNARFSPRHGITFMADELVIPLTNVFQFMFQRNHNHRQAGGSIGVEHFDR